MQELNPLAKVTFLDAKPDLYDSFASYSCVVVSGMPLKEAQEVNALCRSVNTPFLLVEDLGLNALLWNDLGDNYMYSEKVMPKKETKIQEEKVSVRKMCFGIA